MTQDDGMRRWEAAGLAAVLLLAALLRLWRLEANGFGTEYYAAGVRSLLQGGRLFFYNSFDPAGYVSLDKPPVTFWIQAAFARVLGFSGWSIHLPQAVAGVASVAVLHRLVRRPFGRSAALIAAFLLAITPVAVAIDRSNNTDSWLVFFLLLAAAMALRGRGLSFVAAMVLLGVAFNVKMLAALVCGPALLAAWLAANRQAAHDGWRRQFGWVAAGGLAVAVTALSWPVAFDLTPKDERPYAGSTTGNSMLELVVIHNGLERFVRNRPPANPDTSAATSAPPPTANAAANQASAPGYEMYDAVPVGPLRLAHPTLASQFAWLLPLAVLGLVLARRRDKAHPSLALWGVWTLCYGIVFSAAGGIFHAYYLSTLAPPLAALAAVGCVQLWSRGSRALAFGLIVTALWQAYVLGAGPLGWQSVWMAAPVVAVVLAAASWLRGRRAVAAVGGLALLVLPAAWALSPVFSEGNHVLPSASLPRWLGVNDGRGPLLSRNFTLQSDDPKLEAFLLAHRGEARFLVAAPNTQLVAPLVIRTGLPALAFGGFFGRDPILSTEAFADMARRGEVRYVLLGNVGGGQQRQRQQQQLQQSEFVRWVRANAVPVDEQQWHTPSPDGRRTVALYELKGD